MTITELGALREFVGAIAVVGTGPQTEHVLIFRNLSDC